MLLGVLMGVVWEAYGWLQCFVFAEEFIGMMLA
jgi:hypothetical protein